jgi:hypothetical protein
VKYVSSASVVASVARTWAILRNETTEGNYTVRKLAIVSTAVVLLLLSACGEQDGHVVEGPKTGADGKVTIGIHDRVDSTEVTHITGGKELLGCDVGALYPDCKSKSQGG